MRNIYTCTWCSSWSMKISFLVLWDFEHGTKALKTPHCRLQWQQLLKRIQCLSNTILSVNLNNVIISSGNNKSRLLFEAINSCTFWISSKPLKFLSPQDEVTGNVNVGLGRTVPIACILVSIFNDGRNIDKNGRLWISLSNLDKVESLFCRTKPEEESHDTRTCLRASRKVHSIFNENLLKVKNAVDLLASVAHVISDSDRVEAIINGLSEEYDTFVILSIIDQKYMQTMQ